MRLALGTALLFTLVPAAAYPCSIAIQYGQTAPADGVLDAPANSHVIVEAYFFASWPMQAQLLDPTAEGPIDLAIEPLGDDLVSVALPTLTPGLDYEVRFALVDQSADEKTLKLMTNGVADRTPPIVTERLDLEAMPSDFGSCTDPNGWYVRVEYDAATDDRGVAAYLLYEIMPDDGRELRATRLAYPGQPPAPMTAWVGQDFGTHCYALEARDLAGNASQIESIGCVDVGLPGTVDGGSPEPPPPPQDAGTTVDAGPRRSVPPALSREAPSCGCSTTGNSSDGFGGFGLMMPILGLLALRRRRLRLK